ncbi:MAG: winged helix-turn-helix domain-containing protein [Promethearchaeota archaeon]
MNINDTKKEKLVENILGSKARIKILKTLAKNKELTLSLIINNTRLNYTNAIRHLNYLKKINIIQEKRFGRIKIFRYKIENIRARSFKNFLEIWEGDYY